MIYMTFSGVLLGPLYKKNLVDESDIFYFFCSGEGKRARGARKGVGGVGFLLRIPGGGGLPGERRRGGPKGREGVHGEFGGGRG